MAIFQLAGLPTTNTFDATYNAPADELISLFGRTFDDTSVGTYDGAYGFQAWALGTDGVLYTEPFVALRDTNTSSPTAQINIGAIPEGFRDADTSIDGVGVYLVQDATEVPLPAGAGMLGFGLLVFGWLRRQRC